MNGLSHFLLNLRRAGFNLPDGWQRLGWWGKPRPAVMALCGWLWCQPLHAEQYRSETREVETPSAAVPEKSLLDQLKDSADPYTKAMILRELAGRSVNEKDYKKAAQYLEQAIRSNGLSGPAAEQMKKDLSALTLASGNFKNQIPQLLKRAGEASATPDIWIALGAAYIENKRYEQAIPWLKKGIAAVPRADPSWKQALLAALLATGREAEAVPLLQEQTRAQPQVRDNWLRLAAIAIKAGDKPRAVATLELAARQGHLQTEEDRLRLVTLTAQIGSPFGAGSLLQRWMERGELAKSTANWNTLAALWSRAREPVLAIPALEEAQRLSPSPDRLLQLGQLYMDREDYARAALALDKAIASGAKSGPALLSLGLAHYQQADTARALDAFREAQRFNDSRKLAADWLRYLESGEARQQALLALQNRPQKQAGRVQLAQTLSGAPLSIVGEAESALPLPTGAAPAAGVAALTPVGADPAGTPDGRIPVWNGGITPQTRPAFTAGVRLADPFPADKPLFTITAANAAQHAAHLAPAHRALLAKYPGYSLPVYASRRTASYPKAIYEASAANNGKARLEGSDALANARLGFPFIQPKNGVEVLWNHRVRYRGDAVEASYTQAVVRPGGDKPQLARQTFKAFFRYGNVRDPVDIATKNMLVYGITHIAEKGSSPDFVALFHETANSVKDPRDIWVLVVKLGRQFRIPPIGYDQPFPASEGLEFIDMVDMYNGAFDRYVWKLKGKRELYIPYNAYRLSDGSIPYSQLLKPNHPDQSRARYELHRVWVVEATERGGKRHVFGKRTFYVDEDSWNVVLVENEDREGRLWRFQEGHVLPLYDVQAVTTLPTYTYDLKDGRYLANRLFGEDPWFRFDVPMKENDFMPATVRTRYAR